MLTHVFPHLKPDAYFWSSSDWFAALPSAFLVTGSMFGGLIWLYSVQELFGRHECTYDYLDLCFKTFIKIPC